MAKPFQVHVPGVPVGDVVTRQEALVLESFPLYRVVRVRVRPCEAVRGRRVCVEKRLEHVDVIFFSVAGHEPSLLGVIITLVEQSELLRKGKILEV